MPAFVAFFFFSKTVTKSAIMKRFCYFLCVVCIYVCVFFFFNNSLGVVLMFRRCC